MREIRLDKDVRIQYNDKVVVLEKGDVIIVTESDEYSDARDLVMQVAHELTRRGTIPTDMRDVMTFYEFEIQELVNWVLSETRKGKSERQIKKALLDYRAMEVFYALA